MDGGWGQSTGLKTAVLQGLKNSLKDKSGTVISLIASSEF